MITPDFHSPQKTKLLWVYEGLTEYLGEVLSVRAGLLTPDEYKLTFTAHVRGLSRTAGRQWRPLADTAVAGHLFRNPGQAWNELRRGQDFYMEGKLLWYECDAIIREKTEGAKSWTTSAERFFAPVRASRPSPGTTSPTWSAT
jgi:predicted metalloprotease with PDZ domain